MECGQAASYRARGGPCLIERANPTSFLRPSASSGNHSEEDPRHKFSSELEALVFGVAEPEERPQIIGHWEHPAFSVLRRFRIQPHLASVEIDLSPFKREHFRLNAPREA